MILIRSKLILWSPSEELVQSHSLSIDVPCLLACCGNGSKHFIRKAGVPAIALFLNNLKKIP